MLTGALPSKIFPVLSISGYLYRESFVLSRISNHILQIICYVILCYGIAK